MGTIELIPAIAATYVPGAPFVPTDIAGLVAWYDFSDIATLWQDTARTSAVTVDAQTIKGLTDKSGAGNHLAEASNPPTYKTAIQNGQSISRWAGPQNMSQSGTTIAQPFTIVAAVNMNSATAIQRSVFGCTGNFSVVYLDASHFLSGFTTGGGAIAGAVDRSSAWHSVAWIINGTSSAIYCDASTDFSAATNVGTGSLVNLLLGAQKGPVNMFVGDMGEILIYNSALSVANKSAAIAYLKSKWGTP